VQWTFSPSDYENQLIRPGTYTYTYDVSVNDDVVKQSFSVDVVVVDPCSPPVIT